MTGHRDAEPGAHAVRPDLLGRWADRWRYPGLLALLGREAEEPALSAEALATAISEGFAHPVTGPEQAALALVARGEFAAAREVPGWSDTASVTSTAVAEAKAKLGRRRDQLNRRATRAGVSHRPPEGIEDLVEVRLADAEKAFDRWQEAFEKDVSRRAAELEDRLTAAVEEAGWGVGDDTPDPARTGWQQAVQNCLDHGELAAADRLLAAGPSPEVLGGPLLVPHLRTWPWSEMPLSEVLAWYSGEVSTRPEFASQWRPSDESGSALIEALAELHRRRSSDTVRTFAHALDNHLGADGARHSVEESGRGFLTWLSGVADYRRFPQLALPRKLRFYAGPDDWVPEVREEDMPAVWLVLRTQATPAQRDFCPPGVALLDARTVLELAAPDRHGRVTTRGSRRVNLLRRVGRGLRVVDVTGLEPPADDPAGPATHPHEEHEDLAWWLDLLGVRYSDAVVDMLLYDTDGHPVALRAALAGLLPDDDRPFELTPGALEEWRSDAAAQAAFHDTVVERSFLGSDREAAVALRAVLLLIHGEAVLAVTAQDIAGALDPSESGGARLPMEPGAALARVAAAGYLRQEEGFRYRWNGPGLAALLTGPDPAHVDTRLKEDLRALYDRRDRSDRSAVLGLLDVSESYTHTKVNRLTGAEGIIRRLLEDEGLSQEQRRDELRRLQRAVADSQRADADSRNPQRLREDLTTKEPLDLRDSLLRIRNALLEQAPASVTVNFVSTVRQEVVVWASRPLLKTAVDNLLHNALREVGPKGIVRLTLELLPRGRDTGRGQIARVTVEDSGPGVPDSWLPFLNGETPEAPAAPKGSGRGVTFARNFIAEHNGTLVFLARSEDLGGAHVRIELPVTEAPPSR